MDEKLSRRDLLQHSAALGAFVVWAGSACNKGPAQFSCTDTTGLSAGDVQIRTSLGYIDTSTQPGKTCSGCQQFVAPAAAGTCGTCKILKGPVHPNGYCKSFVAKPT
jgi:hypothetical protein